MEWKRTTLFVLLLALSAFIFGAITFFGAFRMGAYLSLFLPLFFIVFAIFLFLTVKEYSAKKLFILFLLIVAYWLILDIPFPRCDFSGKISSPSQECTCLGFKKMIGVQDGYWSECVGIPINYKTKIAENIGRLKKEEDLEIMRWRTMQERLDSDPRLRLSIQTDVLRIRKKYSENFIFGVRNIKNISLTFTVDNSEISKSDNNTIIELGAGSELSFETAASYTLAPSEVKIYNMTIGPIDQTGSYLVRLKIIDQESTERIYAEKQFIVRILEEPARETIVPKGEEYLNTSVTEKPALWP